MQRPIRNSQAGFSMISVLMGLLFTGIAATVVMKSVEFYQTQTSISKAVPVVTRYATQLINGASRMLLDTGPEGMRKDGVCALASTDTPSPGVGLINLTLPAYSGKSKLAFSESRWAEKMSGWEPTSLNVSQGCAYSDNWRRCFRLSDKNRAELSDKKVKMHDIVGSVQIIPTYANPAKGLFSKIAIDDGGKTLDIKDVGFLLVAEVSYKTDPKAGKRRTKRLTEFVWAPSAGVCDGSLKDGKKVLLSLAGTGASNPDGNTVYNRSYFGSEPDAPLITEFRKTQIQEGKITDNGQFITTDLNKNIAVACNERKYRCPLTPSSKREYAPVTATIDIDYNPHNTLVPTGLAASMTLRPSLKISKGYGDVVGSGSSASYTLDGTGGSSFRVSGSHQLTTEITDKGSTSNANSMCREICTEASHYNRGGDSSASRYRPSLSYEFAEFPGKAFKKEADEEVGCTACYMRNCAQIGLGTFGPMYKQPDQPLDSNIPECWLTEPAAANDKPFADTATFDASGLSGDSDCIAARLDGTADRLVLSARSCDSKLPVICYAFGSFAIARELSSSNWTVDRRSHDTAGTACFEMGFEAAREQDLNKVLDKSEEKILPDGKGGTIRLANLATQGMFIAPQINKDVAALRRWTTKNGVSGDFWIALKRQDGKLQALPPMVVNAKRKDHVAMYYDTSGYLTTDEFDFDLDAFGSGDAELLFHHIKFKGVLRAAETQGRLRFLCKRGDQFVASKARSTAIANGTAICEAEGGSFERPSTSFDWLMGLVAVQPLLADQPFSDLSVRSADKLDPLWVRTPGVADGSGDDAATSTDSGTGSDTSVESDQIQ